MAHRVGSIEPGKAADLLVVNKDPTADADVLYDARNIRWIISNGRLAVEDGRLAY
jgi:imidazolonepropionase-like amidohydrolase